jgi:uncharacterized protein GlcG (DUF336 family)
MGAYNARRKPVKRKLTKKHFSFCFFFALPIAESISAFAIPSAGENSEANGTSGRTATAPVRGQRPSACRKEGRSMGMFSWWSRSVSKKNKARPASRRRQLRVEVLEDRLAPSTASLSGGVLMVNGTAGPDRLVITTNAAMNQILVENSGAIIGDFATGTVNSIDVFSGNGNDYVNISSAVKQPALIVGGTGKDILIGGGGPTTIQGGGNGSILSGGTGPTTIFGGTGNQLLAGGTGPNAVTTGTGTTNVQNVSVTDTVTTTSASDKVLVNTNPPIAPAPEMTTSDVQQLLLRATAADPTGTAIIAIVDRNGRILGVRVDNNVSPLITNNVTNLVFSVDGAVALARSGAFFSSNAAPLTSRTVGNLSQTTITQREVDSNPDLPMTSTSEGPGFVAPVEIGAHFPPGIPNTPEVDLFDIEGTNRDTDIGPGPDGGRGPGDYTLLPSRFNVPTQYIPVGQTEYAPESYGLFSGLLPFAQSRGIGTLPGGIPLYKDGSLVGGIGVFFPGTTGYASAENSVLSATYNPKLPDLSQQAEYIAFAAAGGSSTANARIGALGGIPPVPGYDLKPVAIYLAGVELDGVGPYGSVVGPEKVAALGASLGTESPFNGTFKQVTPTGLDFVAGLPVPSGWLVVPHSGVGITASQVLQTIDAGIEQASITRSQLRPLNSAAQMIFAVSDLDGNLVGLYRMPDAPVFSINVAVAKARNVAYYDNPAELQTSDELPGIAAGVSFTSRTFRFLALPRYPSGSEGTPPGFFSILNDGGVDPNTGLTVGAPLPPSAFQSEQGYTAFHPNANFHDPFNILNQSGVVFFPGSEALYDTSGTTTSIIGGFGTSGDGVNQDDVISYASTQSLPPENGILRADQVFFRGVRLPYANFDRNAEGGTIQDG